MVLSTPLEPTLHLVNHVYVKPFYFNACIIFPPIPRFYKWSLSCKFSLQIVCAFIITLVDATQSINSVPLYLRSAVNCCALVYDLLACTRAVRKETKLYFFFNLLLYLQLNQTCLLQSTPLHS